MFVANVFDITLEFNQRVIKDLQVRALNTSASTNLWMKGPFSRIIEQQVPPLEVKACWNKPSTEICTDDKKDLIELLAEVKGGARQVLTGRILTVDGEVSIKLPVVLDVDHNGRPYAHLASPKPLQLHMKKLKVTYEGSKWPEFLAKFDPAKEETALRPMLTTQLMKTLAGIPLTYMPYSLPVTMPLQSGKGNGALPITDAKAQLVKASNSVVLGLMLDQARCAPSVFSTLLTGRTKYNAALGLSTDGLNSLLSYLCKQGRAAGSLAHSQWGPINWQWESLAVTLYRGGLHLTGMLQQGRYKTLVHADIQCFLDKDGCLQSRLWSTNTDMATAETILASWSTLLKVLLRLRVPGKQDRDQLDRERLYQCFNIPGTSEAVEAAARALVVEDGRLILYYRIPKTLKGIPIEQPPAKPIVVISQPKIPQQMVQGTPVTAQIDAKIIKESSPPYDYVWTTDRSPEPGPEHGSKLAIRKLPPLRKIPFLLAAQSGPQKLADVHLKIIDMFGQVTEVQGPAKYHPYLKLEKNSQQVTGGLGKPLPSSPPKQKEKKEILSWKVPVILLVILFFIIFSAIIATALLASNIGKSGPSTPTDPPSFSLIPVTPTATSTSSTPSPSSTPPIPPSSTVTPLISPSSTVVPSPHVPFSVTGIEATVSPETYDCSKTSVVIHFKAIITLAPSSKGGKITYAWKHPNGISSSQTLPVQAGQTSIQVPDETWKVDTQETDGTSWGQVVISAPNPLVSNQATFTKSCPFKVTGVHVTASPATYDCSKTSVAVHFQATITPAPGSKGGTITYTWQRSDGTSSLPRTIPVAAGQKSIPVSDETWNVDASHLDGTSWEQVVISAPNSITSNQATFTKSCSFNVTGVKVSVNPSNFDGLCTNQMTFTFTATVSVPAGTSGGQVSYIWHRSDGGSTDSTEPIHFDSGVTTQTVTTTWQLGALQGDGSQRWGDLEVTAPNSVTSAPANFKFVCQFRVLGIHDVTVSPTTYPTDIQSESHQTGSPLLDLTRISSYCNNSSSAFHLNAKIDVSPSPFVKPVTYAWEHFKGKNSLKLTSQPPPMTIQPSELGQQTTVDAKEDIWTMNVDDPMDIYSGWLHVSAPNTIFSSPVTFTKSCNGAQPAFGVTGIDPITVSPTTYDCGQNQMTFTFSGKAIHIRPGSNGGDLTYTWKRSDGATTSPKTITVAPGQTTVPIPSDMWTLGVGAPKGSYWEQIVVSTPSNSVTSNQATFTKSCQPSPAELVVSPSSLTIDKDKNCGSTNGEPTGWLCKVQLTNKGGETTHWRAQNTSSISVADSTGSPLEGDLAPGQAQGLNILVVDYECSNPKLTFTSSSGENATLSTICPSQQLRPTSTPMPSPTVASTQTPSPTMVPTPTVAPIPVPTPTPTSMSTPAPTVEPIQPPASTVEPTQPPAPTVEPTQLPAPTAEPTQPPAPTVEPTQPPAPTVEPTQPPAPTVEPTQSPAPTVEPTQPPAPTVEPTQPPAPTVEPTRPTTVPPISPRAGVPPAPTPAPTQSAASNEPG